MKATQLITELAKLIAEHGDQEVRGSWYDSADTDEVVDVVFDDRKTTFGFWVIGPDPNV